MSEVKYYISCFVMWTAFFSMIIFLYAKGEVFNYLGFFE